MNSGNHKGQLQRVRPADGRLNSVLKRGSPAPWQQKRALQRTDMLYDWYPATRGDIRRLEKKMSDQQTQINNIAAELGAMKGVLTAVQQDTQQLNDGIVGLEAASASLKAQLAALQASQPSVDLGGLLSVVSDMDVQVGALKSAADAAVSRLATPVA